MRTLLIDNHDSFTYNLFHLLAQVNGREPEVITNDDPRWRPGHLDAFDNVVLSPGPGHPSRPGDFGVCTEIVQQGSAPVLGVCLGHQGLAHLHGGRVAGSGPFHGRTSPVHHDGADLFAGIPSPFTVVRYHSLAVDELPPELAAIAWTADGVLMGLQHRTRPMWGVQFHPESVCSEHGRTLLTNFRRLAEQANRRTGRVTSRSVPSPRACAAESTPAPTRRLRVLARSLPTRRDGEQIFDRLFRGNDHAYWLDSSRPGGPDARFSIMGDAAGRLARVATADVGSGTVRIDSAAGQEIVHGEFLSWLGQDLDGLHTEAPELPTDFALGWVGYLGYELKAECGGRARHQAETPDAVMVFSDRAAVLDHESARVHLLALVEDGAATAADDDGALAWFDAAASRLAAPDVVDAPAPAPADVGPLGLRHDRDAYLARIDAAQREIDAGETYEVCLTNAIRATGAVDVWSAYRQLRRTCPGPFGALLAFGEVAVLSTSPERFLRVGSDGALESRPIKGTRPRGATPREDRELAEQLARDPKDRAENLMIVDLVRNDLGRCAEVGSVVADDIFRVETYSTVHQLVSTVRAQSRAGVGAIECVRAAFPPGSMTGAPKERTMTIIDELEDGPRGVYSGAIGYVSLVGGADFSVAIRTTVVTPGQISYGVGGAIIALSDPAAEFDETVVKSRPLTCLTGQRLDAATPAVRSQQAGSPSLARTTALSSSQ